MKSTVAVFVFALFSLGAAALVPAQQRDKTLTATQIEKLAEGLQQDSAAESGRSKNELIDYLSSSKGIVVSERTKSILEAEFLKDANKETILLAGLAGVDAVSKQIREMADAPIVEPRAGRFFGTKEWAANLVQARNGDVASADKLLDFTKSQDLHTQVVFVAVDLKYAPHPAVVDYLGRILNSNERLEPVKATVKGMPVANYAASSLAKILKGFPVDYREDYSYSPQEIQSCRSWMAAQKEWNFN